MNLCQTFVTFQWLLSPLSFIVSRAIWCFVCLDWFCNARENLFTVDHKHSCVFFFFFCRSTTHTLWPHIEYKHNCLFYYISASFSCGLQGRLERLLFSFYTQFLARYGYFDSPMPSGDSLMLILCLGGEKKSSRSDN